MKGEGLYKMSKLMGNSPEVCRKRYAALVRETPGDSVEFVRDEPVPANSVRVFA